MTPFTLKRGDRLPRLRYALLNPDGTPADLTGATVVFNMRQGATMKVNRGAATIVSASPAVVEYAWGAADTDTVGPFDWEFEVTYPGGLRLTYPNAGHGRGDVGEDLG